MGCTRKIKGKPHGLAGPWGVGVSGGRLSDNSWKVQTRLMRPGGTSRGQYQSPFLLLRSQDRGTSTSRTTVLSTRPPCRLTTWRTAHQVLAGQHAQTTGSLPLAWLVSRPSRRTELRLRAEVA